MPTYLYEEKGNRGGHFRHSCIKDPPFSPSIHRRITHYSPQKIKYPCVNGNSSAGSAVQTLPSASTIYHPPRKHERQHKSPAQKVQRTRMILRWVCKTYVSLRINPHPRQGIIEGHVALGDGTATADGLDAFLQAQRGDVIFI